MNTLKKLFIDYLSEHKRALEKGILEYEKGISDDVAKVWFKSVLCINSVRKDIEEFEKKQEPSFEDILDFSFYLEDCLIDLYKSVLTQTDLNSIKDKFENLVNMKVK